MQIRKRLAQFILGKEFVHSVLVQDFMSTLGWSGSENPEQLVQKGTKGWGYTCITKNASACAQVPLRLYSAKGSKSSEKHKHFKIKDVDRCDFLRHKLAERVASNKEIVEITDHPILDLLKSVNPTQNAYELKELTFRFLEAIATSYWYLQRGAENEIIAIWPLIAQRVKIAKNKGIGISHFEYGSGPNPLRIECEDMIHFKFPSMVDPFGGDAPLKACEQAVDLHDFMNRFEIASFKNGGKPNTIMEVGENGFIDEKEAKRIESKFRRKYGGVDNNGKFMVLRGGATLKEFGYSPKEMSFTKGRSSVLEEICGAFGVPMSFVKIQDISRANAHASLDMWAQFTLNPRLVMVEQKLNEQFTPNWSDDLYLLFDDARPKDREYRIKERESNITIQYSSINEEREADGKEPVPWGDEPVQQNVSRETPPEGTPPAEPKKSEKREGPKNPPPTPDAMSFTFRTMLTVLFKQMQAEIVRNIENYKDVPNMSTKATAEDMISFIFDRKKWEAAIEAEIVPFTRGIMVQSIIEALEKISPESVYNASSPEVLKALEDRRGSIKSIASATEGEVRELLSEGIGNGESRSQLIKRVRDNFDARFKADRVVRTESIWAHNEGTMQAWKQSGVVSAKKWDTVIDDRNCPYCAAMDGKIVDIDGNFHEKGSEMEVNGSKLRFNYEDVKHPPLHPNCRCQIIPILIED